jgi:ATP-dependent DNA ligase
MDENKNYIMTSRVGTGFNDRMRRELFYWAHDNAVKETDEIIWVKPERIAEVIYRDVHKSKRPVYKYFRGWNKVGTTMSYTLFQPSFSRFRSDKGLNPYDLREEQIPDTLLRK